VQFPAGVGVALNAEIATNIGIQAGTIVAIKNGGDDSDPAHGKVAGRAHADRFVAARKKRAEKSTEDSLIRETDPAQRCQHTPRIDSRRMFIAFAGRVGRQAATDPFRNAKTCLVAEGASDHGTAG
jgi:hypothetical protein